MAWEHQHTCNVEGCEIHLGEGMLGWQESDKAQMLAAYQAGMTQREIAEEFHTDQHRVWKILKEMR